MNRFSTVMAGYALHAYRQSGLYPINYDWGFSGGHAGPGTFDMVMHSHTHHPFLEQGSIRAFETRPDYDYVCGDATNFWPLDQVRSLYRQLVFIKPDVVILYDRGELTGPDVPRAWVTVAGFTPQAQGNTFTVQGKRSAMSGKFILPAGVKVSCRGVDIRAEDPKPTARVEYLLCIQLTDDKPAPLKVRAIRSPTRAGCALNTNGKVWKVAFSREGVPGGEVSCGKDAAVELPAGVNDTYEHWKDDPRFKMWMTDPRFGLVMHPRDLERFGGK